MLYSYIQDSNGIEQIFEGINRDLVRPDISFVKLDITSCH